MYSSRSRDCDGLLPASCALESVVFENCTSDLEELLPMFAGSANSLRAIEVQGGGDVSNRYTTPESHILMHLVAYSQILYSV